MKCSLTLGFSIKRNMQLCATISRVRDPAGFGCKVGILRNTSVVKRPIVTSIIRNCRIIPGYHMDAPYLVLGSPHISPIKQQGPIKGPRCSPEIPGPKPCSRGNFHLVVPAMEESFPTLPKSLGPWPLTLNPKS